MGQFVRFSPPRPNRRCPFSLPTIAVTRRNGRDAPIPALSVLASEREGSTRSRPSTLAGGTALDALKRP